VLQSYDKSSLYNQPQKRARIPKANRLDLIRTVMSVELSRPQKGGVSKRRRARHSWAGWLPLTSPIMVFYS